MVLPVLVPLLLLGAALCVLRLRSPASVVLLAILAASAGNVLVQETLWYPRYIIAMSFVTVLIAVGLRYTLPLLWPRDRLPESARWRAVGAALTPLIAGLALIWQLVYFAGPYQRAFGISWRSGDAYYDSNDAILRIARLPDASRYEVIIVSRANEDVHVARGLHDFLIQSAYGLDVLAVDRFTAEYLAQLQRDRGYAFALEPGDTASYALLADAFDLEAPLYSTTQWMPADQAYLLYLVPPPVDASNN
jgi:hypothetical protein